MEEDVIVGQRLHPEQGTDGTVDERAVIVSSDGHAAAEMKDWAPYLPAHLREDFAEFCKRYEKTGSRNFEPRALSVRLDRDALEQWTSELFETGRLSGISDPHRRLCEIDREGIAAEVLFPDFGLPFELLGGPTAAGAGRQQERTSEQVEAGNTAFNRWLSDFVSVAPQRWAGMAAVSFDDVRHAMDEIRLAKEGGLKGIVLPQFDDDSPCFDARYEPVWSLLEELGMVVNLHAAISSITKHRSKLPSSANPLCASPMFARVTRFRTQQLLVQMIWGGILERHPRLKVVVTEAYSAWILDTLRGMDHTFEGSYLRRDIRDVVKVRPSEYFQRQCFIGASLFSRAEVAHRHEIGVTKMMLGMDYPHHEGTLAVGTQDYLQATVGDAHVPADEARLMLGETAAEVFDFDRAEVRAIADRVGVPLDTLLTPSDKSRLARGDISRPLLFV